MKLLVLLVCAGALSSSILATPLPSLAREEAKSLLTSPSTEASVDDAAAAAALTGSMHARGETPPLSPSPAFLTVDHDLEDQETLVRRGMTRLRVPRKVPKVYIRKTITRGTRKTKVIAKKASVGIKRRASRFAKEANQVWYEINHGNPNYEPHQMWGDSREAENWKYNRPG